MKKFILKYMVWITLAVQFLFSGTPIWAMTCQETVINSINRPNIIFLTEPIFIESSSGNLTRVPIFDLPSGEKLVEFSKSLGRNEIAIVKTSYLGTHLVILKGKIYAVSEDFKHRQSEIRRFLTWAGFLKRKAIPSGGLSIEPERDYVPYWNLRGDVIFEDSGMVPLNLIYRMFRRPTYKGTVLELPEEIYRELIEKLDSGEQFAFSPDLEGSFNQSNITFKGANIGSVIDGAVFTSLAISIIMIGVTLSGL